MKRTLMEKERMMVVKDRMELILQPVERRK